MATVAHTLSPPDMVGRDADQKAISNSPNQVNGTTTGPRILNAPSKYRHIAAVHSRVCSSCLSRDAESTPSFIGFRNLMVIVLSTYIVTFYVRRRQ